MGRLTGTREHGNAGTREGERGAALVTVLILIIVLTVVGAAMVNVALTEVTIAYNQGDAAAARAAAEAGVARAVYELGVNPAWAGVTDVIGDGQYQVTVTSNGTIRFIESIGTRGGGRRRVRVAVKALPQYLLYAVLANTTATLGSATAGVTIRNAMPSADAGAVHASNRRGAATAITINPAGAVVVGNVTANGAISPANLCLTWPWRCSTAFGVMPFPRLDVDSGSLTSLRNRARNTPDPADGLPLYFNGGDASRCNRGGTWNFGNQETQRCWDKYVNDVNTRPGGGVLGQGITNPIFFVEFNNNENTSYRQPGGGPPGPRTVDCIGFPTNIRETLCIRARPAQARSGNVEFGVSDLRQVTGTIVAFRRQPGGGGTTVVGDIALENVALRTTDYIHRSLGGDPAFLAAGQLWVNSSGAAAASRTVTVHGFVYTMGGTDNPDVNGNLQGAAGTGINIQHGASLVALIFEGIVMSNGSITIQVAGLNAGTVAVEYDSAATDLLPSVFSSAAAGRIILPISWSSGD